MLHADRARISCGSVIYAAQTLPIDALLRAQPACAYYAHSYFLCVRAADTDSKTGDDGRSGGLR